MFKAHVIGLKIQYYDYNNESINRRNIICLEDYENKQKYELLLCIENKNLIKSFNKVNSFGELTHDVKGRANSYEAKKNAYVCIHDNFQIKYFTSSWFHYGDIINNAHIRILFEAFQPAFPKICEIIWIFCKGEEKLDLETLYLATGVTRTYIELFDTDDHEILPEKILEYVIIIGKKYNHKLDDILKRIIGRPVKVNLIC